MRVRYEITPPAARLAVLIFQVNDAGGTLKGHREAQHAVLHDEFLGFLIGGARRVLHLLAVRMGNMGEVSGLRLKSADPENGRHFLIIQVVGDLNIAVVNDCIHVVLEAGGVLLNPGAISTRSRTRCEFERQTSTELL